MIVPEYFLSRIWGNKYYEIFANKKQIFSYRELMISPSEQLVYLAI